MLFVSINVPEAYTTSSVQTQGTHNSYSCKQTSIRTVLDKQPCIPILELSSTISIILNKCVSCPELTGHYCIP